MNRLAFFISGTGGNALNLLKACHEGHVPAEPVVVISSNAKALGNERLRQAGLPVHVVERKNFDNDGSFSEACYALVEEAGAEVICLCGWLKKLEVPIRWHSNILNIHPGLLPRFGGPGMYGMHVHRAVIASGETESGCTIHLVDNVYDHGRILAEARVPVLPGDSPELLQKRVYEQEMKLYPEAVADYLERTHP